MSGANWWMDFGPYLAIMMGFGAFLVVKMGDRLIKAANTPKNMTEWYPVLEEAYLRVVHKNRELLEAVAHAEETKKSLPPEYQAVLDQVIMLARLIEQASYEAAVENGTVPRYWFGGPGEKPDLATTPSGEDPPSSPYEGPQLVSDETQKSKIVALPTIAREWIRTQVVGKAI